jgi:hypothetical protein
MVKGMFKKGLVVGIIILFVGVGTQSAFANDISISSFDDDTPPEVELIFYMSPTMEPTFEALCSDDTGIDRVEFTVDGGLWCVVPHEPYIWMCDIIPYNHIICAVAYDHAGNSAEDCIDFRSRSNEIETLDTYREIFTKIHIGVTEGASYTVKKSGMGILFRHVEIWCEESFDISGYYLDSIIPRYFSVTVHKIVAPKCFVYFEGNQFPGLIGIHALAIGNIEWS